MIRRNRAQHMLAIEAGEVSFETRGMVQLKTWLLKKRFITLSRNSTGEVVMVLTPHGSDSLAQYERDCERHKVKPYDC